MRGSPRNRVQMYDREQNQNAEDTGVSNVKAREDFPSEKNDVSVRLTDNEINLETNKSNDVLK